MGLNKKSVDDITRKGQESLVRCDLNVPLKNGEITDDTRIVAALLHQEVIGDGGKVILCSHLGKVKNGPTKANLWTCCRDCREVGKEVTFVADYNVTAKQYQGC